MNNEDKFSRAALLFQTNSFEEAQTLCEQIIDKDPRNTTALIMLGKLAQGRSDFRQSACYFEKAHQVDTQNVDVLIELGRAQTAAGNNGEALSRLRSAMSEHMSPQQYQGLGFALTDAGALDEAREIFDSLVKQEPLNPHLYSHLIRVHLMCGEPELALSVCERCLQVEPAYTRAFALKQVALSEAGRMDEFHYLFDHENYIRQIEMDCPESFSNTDDFNSYLADYILTNVDLREDPDDTTTQHGLQSEFGKVFKNSRVLGDSVHEMINHALREYMDRLPPDPEHPVNTTRPSDTTLLSWAVVLKTGGYQGSHIHPKSWLAGVYYVQIPNESDAHSVDASGHIVFGSPPEKLSPIRTPETKIVKPVEGNFVIFPGYFWHHTIPLRSEKYRISLAFDLQPTKGWGK